MQSNYTEATRGQWGKLRTGLLSDLGYDSVQQLAEEINYPNHPDIEQALNGGVPSDALMSALLRAFPAVPPLYFIERNDTITPAA